MVIYDCEMYFTGASLAEKLAREGKDVTYVTPFDGVAPYTRYTLESPRLNRTLRELGVDVVLEHVLVSVEQATAPLADIWTDEEKVVDADTIVLVTQRISDDALYRELSSDRGSPRGRRDHGPLRDR